MALRRPSRPAALAGLAVASLGAHLALLVLLAADPTLLGSRPSLQPTHPAQGLRVSRVVIRPAQDPPPEAATAATPEAADTVLPTAPEPADTTRPSPDQHGVQGSTPQPAQVAPATASAEGLPLPAAQPGTALDSAPPQTAGQPDGEEYLPRSALTTPPQARGSVLLAYPDDAPVGLYRGVLTLFIDERGAVQRVRVETGEAELPALFQEAARQAFLAAQFSPGELQGRAVKSRIRIAVEFEAATPAPGTAP